MTLTRFKDLGLTRYNREWSFVDVSTGNAVGPRYKTKAEALADLGDYAKRAGWENDTAS